MDSIGDFLTIIRNGVMASKPWVACPYSKVRHQLADLLKEKGFVRDVSVVEVEGDAQKQLKIVLKYVDGESVIHQIDRKSTPGSRKYTGIKSVRPVIGGLGVTILTTNRGILSHDEAKALNVGGEVICTVW